MNWLDIILLCLAVIGLMKGLFDGIIKQVISLIALIIGIILCGKAAAWLKGYIIALDWFSESWVSIISYILGFIIVITVILVAGEIIHRVIGATPLSVLNHLAGAFFGVIVMALFASLCFNLFELIDTSSTLIPMHTKMESRLYYPIKEIIPTVFPHNLFALGE
ncbi:CvpA family protein [Parabacteroides sp. PF5-9]|uniref:CvpA family protein n=1 Tax=Parabacteroides sp. PF5-9 TaxID=1742404 RepID=UPI00247476B1|nr:CvpA family protein [Parabacteroides sp. PF5-9]MDH6356889.1 membrane protein required for colicin V production [Parabacteroides sp. PF5-9]